jgi:hypothetical protein
MFCGNGMWKELRNEHLWFQTIDLCIQHGAACFRRCVSERCVAGDVKAQTSWGSWHCCHAALSSDVTHLVMMIEDEAFKDTGTTRIGA